MPLFKLFRLTVAVTALLVISTSPINAAEAETSNNLLVEVNEDLSAQVTYSITVQNNYAGNYVAKLRIALPFPGASKITPSARGIILPYSSSLNGSYTSIEVDLSGFEFKPYTTEEVKIQFHTQQVARKIFGYNIFQYDSIFPSNNLDRFQLNISTPTSWGKAIYYTNAVKEKQVSNRNIYSYRLDGRNLLIVWGQNPVMNIASSFEIDSPTAGSFLVSIPRSDSGQTVSWNKFAENTTGYYDTNNNQFVSYSLNPGLNQINYSGSVVLKSHNPLTDLDNFVVANDTWPATLPEVTNARTQFAQLQSIYKYILTSYTPARANYIDRATLLANRDYSYRTPVEYCHFLTALAGKYGIGSRMNYGMLLFPINDAIDTTKLHVWCEFRIGDSVYVADPFLEDATGHEFLTQSRIGKLSFGTFQIQQQSYPAFGLLNDSPQPLPTVLHITNPIDNEQRIVMSDIYELDGNSISMTIHNPGSKTFPIYSIKINNEMVPLNNTGLLPLIIPKANNNIKLAGVGDYLENATIVVQTSDSELTAEFSKTEGWHQTTDTLAEDPLPIFVLATVVGLLLLLVIISRDKQLQKRLIKAARSLTKRN
jgi:hypothetical protein